MPVVSSSFVSHTVRVLCALGVFTLGVATCLRHLVGLDGSRLPGDLMDSRFVGYVLEHGSLWLAGKTASFWSAPFYYPMTHTLALSDNMAGTLPFYAGLRLLAPGPEQAMVGLVILFFLLNFVLTVCCFRGFGVGFGASLVAAYPVTFGLTAASLCLHPQYLALYPVVLGVLALGRYLAAPSPRGAGLLISSLTLLALTSFYYFIFFGLLTAVAFALAFAVRLTRVSGVMRSLRWNPFLYACLGCCLLVLALDYWPYFQEGLETGPWPDSPSRTLAPSLGAFLAPPFGSWAWGWLEGIMHPGPEGALFPGLFPVAGMLFGLWLLWRRPDPAGTVAGVLATAAVLVCAGFLDVWGTGNLLRQMPGVSALRVTTRVAVVALPCFALGLALLLDRLTRRLPSLWRGVALAVALGLVAADQLVLPGGYRSYAWSDAQARVTALMRRVPEDARVFYVHPNVPRDDPGYWAVHLDAMLAAQRLGKATYNGYSSWLPPVLGLFYHQETCASLDGWRNVAAALAHPGENPVGLYDGSAWVDFPTCPPDPAILTRPQGRHAGPLPEAARRVAIRAWASYSRRTGILSVNAAIRNLGASTLHGLGDFSHRGAVFLIAEVVDGSRTKELPLGRLDQSIAPGETHIQHGEVALAPGLSPGQARIVLIQAPAGPFAVAPDRPVEVRIEP